MTENSTEIIEIDMQTAYMGGLGLLHLILGIFYFFRLFDIMFGDVSVTSEAIEDSQRMKTLLPAAGLYFLGIIMKRRFPGDIGNNYNGAKRIIQGLIIILTILLIFIITKESNTVFNNIFSSIIYFICILVISHALLTSNE